MLRGILAAVTTKFTAKNELDINEMQRCFALQMQAGCTGPIACGSLALAGARRAQVEAPVKSVMRTRAAIPALVGG